MEQLKKQLKLIKKLDRTGDIRRQQEERRKFKSMFFQPQHSNKTMIEIATELKLKSVTELLSKYLNLGMI